MTKAKVPLSRTRLTPSYMSRRHTSREAIIGKVLELLPDREGKPLRLADLCKATGVSERTLRSAFSEAFGMGPSRYLRLRRLYLLRAALAVADHRHDTVMAIAMRFGYSDCGRMASEYYALFGEYPSATLLRGVNG